MAVGRVVGAHGLRGELRVRLLDALDTLRSASALRLARETGDPSPVEVRVRALRTGRPGEALLRLESVDDREAAEALRGRLVLARAEDLAPLGPGEYYQYELVGCRVEDGQGRALGRVTGIWETGAPDVLVVADGDRQHLIPAVRSILREVDPEGRRIVIDPPPGLLDPEPGPESDPEGRR